MTGTTLARLEAVDRSVSPPLVHLWVGERLVSLPCPALPAGFVADTLVRFTKREGMIVSMESCGAPAPGAARSPDVLRWRTPGPAGSRLELLRMRQALVARVRRFFEDEDFLEITAPVLLRAPNPEAHFALFAAGDGCLSTSPELQLKRLLVGGAERIVSLGPCFRGFESDATHNPEFTMAEWYRADCGLEAMLEDLERLVGGLAGAFPGFPAAGIRRGGRLVPVPPPPWPRLTVRELVLAHCNLDMAGCTETADLFARGQEAGFFGETERDDDYEQLFSHLWERFADGLGWDGPLFVTEWPAPLASLARLSDGDPSVAERAELVIAGLELANGFAELTDAAEYRRRFERELAVRRQRGLPAWPIDEKFLQSMASGLPPAAGMALGLDRLCLLALGAADIREVLAFGWEER